MTYLIAAIIGSALFRLGGSINKLFRRVGLPVAITAYQCLKTGDLRILWLFPALFIAFCLPYGEEHPYFQKVLASVAWIAPRFFFIGFWWPALLIPPIWIALWWLSNHKPYADVFRWMIVEVIIGGLLGLAYV